MVSVTQERNITVRLANEVKFGYNRDKEEVKRHEGWSESYHP